MPAVQRDASYLAPALGDGASEIASRITRSRGQGAPLPGDVRGRLEPTLGAGLEDVRVHTDGEAHHLSQAFSARAFTTGSDIYFQRGLYQPGTQTGLGLLQHEAAHVLQQRAGPVPGRDWGGGLRVSEPGDAGEREARALENGVDREGQGAERAAPSGHVPAAGTILRSEAPGSPRWDPVTGAPATPIAPAGRIGYYRERHFDYVARNLINGSAPPAYYLQYGAKYADMFTNVLRPKLTKDGQAWLDAARVNLQVAIEGRLNEDPAGFAHLEHDNERFQRFVFDTHPTSYWNAGLGTLRIPDLWCIFWTPDVKDSLLSTDGGRQILEIVRLKLANTPMDTGGGEGAEPVPGPQTGAGGAPG